MRCVAVVVCVVAAAAADWAQLSQEAHRALQVVEDLYKLRQDLGRAPLDQQTIDEWRAYKLLYGKRYPSDDEELFRLSVYLLTKREVEEHNERFERGLETYTMAVNHFSDLLQHEFDALNTYNATDSDSDYLGVYTGEGEEEDLSPAPSVNSLDWTQRGAVTAVKSQGHCGSCWAFGATGALEGRHFVKTGRLVSLSEQNLMDCSTRYGNNACQGGHAVAAFNYIRDNRGVDTETKYPYEQRPDVCRFQRRWVGARDRGAYRVARGERALRRALAGGPVAVALDARYIKSYRKGIFYNTRCSATVLNHAMTLVGYGEENGQEYWLLKNSWNTWWGDNGYMKLARNKNNHCGVATRASFPLV